jgi:rubredoxin
MAASNTKKKEKPEENEVGFFAVIPATVRYDKSLPQGAKLLYGEITALTKKNGYCWARNEWFADLYDTSERTIIEWICRLRDAGHISVYLKYFPDSKKIKKRYISLPYPPNKELPPELTGSHLMVKKTSLPESPVVKKTSLPGGEENSLVINTNSNNTVVVVDQDAQNNEKPPPEETATTIPEESIDRLKHHFAGLDGSLAFDESFYPRLLQYLFERGLSLDYVSWVFLYCSQENAKKHNAKNLSGYLFRVLLEPRYAVMYLDSLSRPSPKPDETVTCPVCGTSFDSSSRFCPVCGLDKDYFRDNEKIECQKKLFTMPKESRAAYEGELDSLNNETSSYGDYSNYKLKKKALDQKYGLS